MTLSATKVKAAKGTDKDYKLTDEKVLNYYRTKNQQSATTLHQALA